MGELNRARFSERVFYNKKEGVMQMQQPLRQFP
jgi:hypothetical protein